MGLYRGKTIYCIVFGKALGFRTHWGLRVLPVDKWGWLKFSPPTSILGHLGKVESPHIHLGEPNNPLTSSWPFFDSRIYSPSSHCSVTLWCGQNNGPTFLFIPLTGLSGSPGHHGNVPCVLPASLPAQGLWSVHTLGIRAGTHDHTTGILAWWLLCPIPVESLPMMVEGSSPTNKGVITLSLGPWWWEEACGDQRCDGELVFWWDWRWGVPVLPGNDFYPCHSQGVCRPLCRNETKLATPKDQARAWALWGTALSCYIPNDSIMQKKGEKRRK